MNHIKYLFILTIFILSNLFLQDNLVAEYTKLTAEQIAELAHSTQRTVVSLQGNWERSTDGTHWKTIAVPSTDYEQGELIYKKEVRLDKSFILSKNIRLLFPALKGQVEIYFNNEFISKFDGEKLPADISIPQKVLLTGTNEIKLVFLANSVLDKMRVALTIASPRIAKGIFVEPFIICTSQIYINELKYEFENNNNLKVNLVCSAGQISEQIIDNDEEKGTVASIKERISAEIQIINKRTNVAISMPETKEFDIEIARTANISFNLQAANILPWSPENPELYKLYVKLRRNDELLDEYFINFGRRNIVAKGKTIMLNGKPIEIKAITYHEHFGNDGYTLSAARLEEDIKNIKLIGANAIHFQFAFPSPYLIYLCDKYGLLLFADIPLINTNSKLLENSEFITQNKNTLSSILQYYSSATSLVGIGIGNCVLESAAYSNLSKNLISSLEETNKLIYKIVDLGNSAFDTDGYDLLFVKTNNAYQTNELITQSIGQIKSECQLPIILNCGSRVVPNNFNGYSDPSSNEYQTHFIKNCYNLSRQHKLAGCLISSYNDYITHFPQMVLNYENQYMHTEGITDLFHNNRTSVATIKALFNDERIPLLNIGTYTNELPISFIIVGLVSILLVVYLANRYNRFREYLIRAFLRSYNFFADIRDRRILSITQTLVLGIIIAIAFGLCWSLLLFSIRGNIAYNYLITGIMPFDNILYVLYKLIWNPSLLLVVLTLIFIIGVVVDTLLVRLLASILRVQLFIDNCFTITIWSALPLLLLLPIGVLLVKLIMVSDVFIVIFLVLFIILFFAYIYRLFKAIAIIFDKRNLQVYSIGAVFIIVTAIIPFLFYENYFGVASAVEYFVQLPK